MLTKHITEGKKSNHNSINRGLVKIYMWHITYGVHIYLLILKQKQQMDRKQYLAPKYK